jgi:hypothetical protein
MTTNFDRMPIATQTRLPHETPGQQYAALYGRTPRPAQARPVIATETLQDLAYEVDGLNPADVCSRRRGRSRMMGNGH